MSPKLETILKKLTIKQWIAIATVIFSLCTASITAYGYYSDVDNRIIKLEECSYETSDKVRTLETIVEDIGINQPLYQYQIKTLTQDLQEVKRDVKEIKNMLIMMK